MTLCNVKPSKLNFLFSKNRRRAKNRFEILFVHNRHERDHDKILERYRMTVERNKLRGYTRYDNINFISIGRFANPKDWSSEWIEEGYYKFPR